MPKPNTLEVCRADLFTKEAELRERYPEETVLKVMRVRDMYSWVIANPDVPDREFIEAHLQKYHLHRATAYADLNVVKALLPMLSTASRDFHRWRTNEMLQETYLMAKSKKDAKTMAATAAAYGKLNRVDLEDEQTMPYEMIVVQPFTATDDPRVLGIEPIPNIKEKIRSMIEKYRAETIDIEDVEYEESDLELGSLFPENNDTDAEQESILQ
ncbi:MAG: hypothetical protein NC217_07730 [Muribaculaceae bacterium]|nr:hypothetical protein [Muribaculaceae bacterium]